MTHSRFRVFAWAVLAYNVLVVIWGAFVRASGAGAGCGSHWPLCNGVVIPRAPAIETVIELTHRTTSGLAGILVIVLIVWAFRLYPSGHIVRKGAAASMILIILEGLVGAALVLFEWVAGNASVGRAVSIAIHLNNTLLLLAALTLTAWWASGGAPFTWQSQRGSARLLLGCLAVFMLLCTAGALTALGDTLFKVGSLTEGIGRDFDAGAHFLERLRILHPIIALATGVLVILSVRSSADRFPIPTIQRLAVLITILFLAQLFAGLTNLFLLAPTWLQLVHLFVADLLWIHLIILYAEVASREQTVVCTTSSLSG